MKFRRYLNVEGRDFDQARVEVSNDGTNWGQIWENPTYDLTDGQWTRAVFDISSIAANQETVYIKFTMGPTNSSRRFSGWNIDDVEITSEAIYPAEGTIGTRIVIPGAGSGTKGKVLIGSVALKIAGWTDAQIVADISKAITPPGVYDLFIQPKGAPEIVEEDYFSVMPPEIEAVEPDSGSPGEGIAIYGKFFGTKGAVSLQCQVAGKPVLKKCKSVWSMNPTTGDSEIRFTVPKGLPSSQICDVTITNSVGTDTLTEGFHVE